MCRTLGSSVVISVGWTNQPSRPSQPPPVMTRMPGVSRASEIAAWCLSNAVCLMTAPMKLGKLGTSPSLSDLMGWIRGGGGRVLVERGLLDDRAHEVGEVGDVAELERLDGVDQRLAHAVPDGPGDVDARGGRALLALELVAAADDGGRERGGVGRAVGEDEVLAAGLADQARVALVAIDVLGDALPHHAEHVGRAGEVDAGGHRGGGGGGGAGGGGGGGGAGGGGGGPPPGAPRPPRGAQTRATRRAAGSRPASRRRCCPSAPAP